MSDLESLGVSVTRRYLSSSSSINGIAISEHESTELTMQLPKTLELKATFSKEGLGRKLVKLFKKELQTGDAAFDDAVYISTDTPDATKVLLADDDVRRAIAFCVTAGGPIELDGALAIFQVPGREDGDEANSVTIVRALLA